MSKAAGLPCAQSLTSKAAGWVQSSLGVGITQPFNNNIIVIKIFILNQILYSAPGYCDTRVLRYLQGFMIPPGCCDTSDITNLYDFIFMRYTMHGILR